MTIQRPLSLNKIDIIIINNKNRFHQYPTGSLPQLHIPMFDSQADMQSPRK
jgi:hypothetical protein